MTPVPAMAAAEPLPADLTRIEGGRVTEVIDGDTVMLADGREVRLVGIQAPKLALGRPDFIDWPLSHESKARLQDMVLGEQVDLAYGGNRMDRHGRHLAHLILSSGPATGRWVQQALLREGLARVYTFADNRAAADSLYAAEQEARDRRNGIWRLHHYHIRSPEEAAALIGTFQLVEGKVVDAAIVRGRGYLNFGSDYRTDFTVSAEPAAMRVIRDARLDWTELEGRHIRVRGWLRDYNGPLIEISHPDPIEILP